MQGNSREAYPTWRLCKFMSEDQPILAVQQLLIKGLFKQETELATVQVILGLWYHLLALATGPDSAVMQSVAFLASSQVSTHTIYRQECAKAAHIAGD